MQNKAYPSVIRLVKLYKSIKIFPPQHCYVITRVRMYVVHTRLIVVHVELTVYHFYM